MVCQCDMLVIVSREVRLVGVSMLECCLLNVRFIGCTYLYAITRSSSIIN